VVGGQDLVADGQHRLVEDVPAALSASIRQVLR